MKLTVNKLRKDKKFMVTLAYDTGKNAFGGLNYPKIYNKLFTFEQIQDYLQKDNVLLINNTYIKFEVTQ